MIAKLIYIDSKMNSIIRKYLYIIIQKESNFVHSAMQVDRIVVLRYSFSALLLEAQISKSVLSNYLFNIETPRRRKNDITVKVFI